MLHKFSLVPVTHAELLIYRFIESDAYYIRLHRIRYYFYLKCFCKLEEAPAMEIRLVVFHSLRNMSTLKVDNIVSRKSRQYCLQFADNFV